MVSRWLGDITSEGYQIALMIAISALSALSARLVINVLV